MVRFVSLSSGSNGNCYYIGNERCAFLIDAGIGPRTIKKRLASHDLSLGSVRFVLVTHEHIDHIKSVGMLAEKMKLPVYATRKLHSVLAYHFCTRGRLSGCIRHTALGEWSEVDDIKFTPFAVPHDAAETVGYHIEIDGVRFTFATDVGDITPELVKYASLANVLILESNYDEQMLANGSYTAHLKARISSGNGHLSNSKAAGLVRQVYSRQMKALFLCHLSENNNTPVLALNSIESALESVGALPGRDIIVEPLPRRTSSHVYTF